MEMHSFTYVKRLILKNANYEAFTNFPVLVIIDDSAGYYPTLTAYNEIAFYASDNTTELKWGCKEFNDGGISYYFVKVPSVAKTNTDYIYMYWGGGTSVEAKSSVFESNWKAVYLMKDKSGDSTVVEDWTSNALNMNKKGANAPVEDDGIFGKCQKYSASNSYMETDASSALWDLQDAGKTIILLAKIPTEITNFKVISRHNIAGNPFWGLYIYNNSIYFVLRNSVGAEYSSFGYRPVVDNTWKLYSWIWSKSGSTATIKVMEDDTILGAPVSNVTGTITANGEDTLGVSLDKISYQAFFGIYDGKLSENYLKAQDKILRTQDYVSYRGIICTFTLADNQLTTVTGADAGTYLITDNKADIVIGGVTHSIYPFSPDYFVSSTNNLLTIEV